MSWNKQLAVFWLCALSGCSMVPAMANNVCAVRNDHPLQYVDVFDGAPEELASLVPDKAEDTYGYWSLGYIYEAGRFVTIRCKYEDGLVTDVKLTTKTSRCEYRSDSHKTLSLSCH